MNLNTMTPAVRLRMWLAMLLIRKQPFLANVEVGGDDRFGVRAYGSLYCDRSVKLRPSPNLLACIVIEERRP